MSMLSKWKGLPLLVLAPLLAELGGRFAGVSDRIEDKSLLLD